MASLYEIFGGLIAIIVASVMLIFRKGGRKPALEGDKFKDFKLISKKEITHNTRIYRFQLEHPEQKLGLPIGRHIRIRAVINGMEYTRAYTPISSDDDLGYFDLLFKVYPTGQLTPFLDRLQIGETISVAGPKGRFEYKPNACKHYAMIAGGTGITPMWQVAQAVLKNPADRADVRLLFGNVSAEDILMRDELAELAKNPRFSAYHVLNNPPEGWTQGKGFIAEEILQSQLWGCDEDVMVLLCGPLPMCKAVKTVLVEKMGFAQDRIFTF